MNSVTEDGSVNLKREPCSLGGRAVRSKRPPDKCPKCNEVMAGRKWHSYLGHLGLHGLADRFFDGCMQSAQKRLRQNSLARSDPSPWNGAWPEYKPILEDLPEALDAPAYPGQEAE